MFLIFSNLFSGLHLFLRVSDSFPVAALRFFCGFLRFQPRPKPAAPPDWATTVAPEPHWARGRPGSELLTAPQNQNDVDVVRRNGCVRILQGCGIKALYEENSLWEALSVVSQKWSFPTALVGIFIVRVEPSLVFLSYPGCGPREVAGLGVRVVEFLNMLDPFSLGVLSEKTKEAVAILGGQSL